MKYPLTLCSTLLAAGLMLGCGDTTTAPVAPESATLASHKPGHEGGPGGGGSPGGGGPGGDSGCQLEFDLELSDANPVRSDGGGIYSDGTDRVAAFTGGGPGFRFDTNGSQKLEARNDRRWVVIDLSGTAWAAHAGPGDLKGIDLRFDDPLLDLCAMAVGDEATVPIDVAFLSSADGEAIGLKYGGTTFSGNACSTTEALVTRTGQNSWSIASGQDACVVRGGDVLDQVAAPFALTLDAQGT